MTQYDAMYAADVARAIAFAGEDLVYVKQDGTTRAIKGIVDRNPPAYERDGKLCRPLIRVEIPNSLTLGINDTEADFGADCIRVPRRPGSSAEDFYIHIPGDGQPWCDAAALRLELE